MDQTEVKSIQNNLNNGKRRRKFRRKCLSIFIKQLDREKFLKIYLQTRGNSIKFFQEIGPDKTNETKKGQHNLTDGDSKLTQ